MCLQVNSQNDNLGGDTASVVLILTDGEIGDQTNANNEVSVLITFDHYA